MPSCASVPRPFRLGSPRALSLERKKDIYFERRVILRRNRGPGKKKVNILAVEKSLKAWGGPGDGADAGRQVRGDTQGPHQ